MAKNERTSRRVASKAAVAQEDVSVLFGLAVKLEERARLMLIEAGFLRSIGNRYASVAGSALTQAPDKSKGARR